MAMTYYEEVAKREILKVLAENGYKAYAKLLQLFEVNITKDPDVVAYMVPDKGKIVVNEGLDIDQVSMVVRHEILHQYLDHHNRLMKHLAKQAGLDYDTLSDMDLKELQNKLYSNQIFNIAGDYEISNRGYTEADKKTARNLYLNGQIVSGLVTELDHPDWVDLSVEEMYDRLNTEENKAKQQAKQSGDQGQSGGSGQDSNQSSDSGQDTNQSGGSDNSSSDSKQSNKSGKSDKTKGPLRIGDTGNPETQAKEEAERIAQAAKEMADEMKNGDSKESDKAADDLEDIADDAKQLVKDAKKMKKFDSIKSDKKAEKDLADRVKKIQDAFRDTTLQSEIIAETNKKIDQEKLDKRAKEIAAYKNSSIVRFKENLNKFIDNEVSYSRESSWKRFNKKYTNSGIIKPGTSRHVEHKIPSINVYFDQSGSWSEDDVKIGINAIGVLNKYVQRGEVKINIYYFANNVHKSAAAARREGGTDLRAVFDHIQQEKPDNVIIMSDSDGDHAKLYPLEVPGAVWLLFRRSRSQNVIDNLHGKKQTKVFNLD